MDVVEKPEKHTFIQWKGTDLCMDFNCPECQGDSHVAGKHVVNIQCPDCGAVFRLNTWVGLTKLDAYPEENVVLAEPI